MNLALVRFQSHSQTGHFDELHNCLMSAAGLKFDSTWTWDLQGLTNEIKLQDLSRRIYDFSPEFIHLEWLHDFESELLEVSAIFDKFKVNWTTVGSISHLVRGSFRNHELSEKLRIAANSPYLKGIYIWDSELALEVRDDFPRLFSLPDYQDITVAEEYKSCCRWAERQKKEILGLVGQLYSYRGVTQLLKWWRKNPTQPILFAGKLEQKSLPLSQNVLLKVGQILRRIFLKSEWIKESSLLNHYLLHLDALFIDTLSYPQPSGIATRARHLGIPVLILRADSYLLDKSKSDHGIRVIDFSKMSLEEINYEIMQGKSFGSVKAPTVMDQTDAIVKGWEA